VSTGLRAPLGLWSSGQRRRELPAPLLRLIDILFTLCIAQPTHRAELWAPSRLLLALHAAEMMRVPSPTLWLCVLLSALLLPSCTRSPLVSGLEVPLSTGVCDELLCAFLQTRPFLLFSTVGCSEGELINDDGGSNSSSILLRCTCALDTNLPITFAIPVANGVVQGCNRTSSSSSSSSGDSGGSSGTSVSGDGSTGTINQHEFDDSASTLSTSVVLVLLLAALSMRGG
jgi:uncharacterized membrane protein YgcG